MGSEATLKAIDRIAPSAKRKRADFIRRAVKDKIFRLESEQMREAYRLRPDSIAGADRWDLAEEWKGGGLALTAAEKSSAHTKTGKSPT